jgi:hypothetical protein
MRLNKAFPTKKEAANFGLEVAKKWIDEKNPKHSQPATESTVDGKSETSPLSDALQPGTPRST